MPKITLASLTLLVIIAMLVSMQAVFDASPATIGKYFVAQLGSVIGVTVNVPPNPFNTLAQQLEEKELALGEREKELQQKEVLFQEETSKERSGQNKLLLFLLALGGTLLVLISVNFYFDYRRRSGYKR